MLFPQTLFVCICCLLFVDLVNHEPFLFLLIVAHLFTFNWMLRPRFLRTLTHKRWLLCVCVCYIILPPFPSISSSIILAYFHHDSSFLAAVHFQFTPICESQRVGVEAAGLDWGVLWGWSGWTFSPTVSLPKRTHTHAHKQNHLNRQWQFCFAPGHRILQFNTGLVSIFLC